MRRRLFSALAFFGALGASIGARAQAVPVSPPLPPPPPAPWSPASRLSLLVDARGEIGPGSVAGIDLGLVGAGIEWRATPTVRLQAAALLLGATGSTDSGRSANGGAGGELAMRLIPFPYGLVRPYLRASGGLLLFLRGPFLPGGDSYDFILQLGAGLEVPLGQRLSVFGDLHAVHLSNGQGLGPSNPAFTGEGALLGAAYALGPPGPTAAPQPIATVDQESLPEKPLEQLPLSRRRLALTGRYARRLDGSTLRLEERVYDDSWGLVASSSDVRWIFDLGRRFEIWPHLRFHAQNSVSFWQRAYVSGPAPGWNLPEYRTGDRELGPLWTTEGGFGVKWYLGSDAEPEQWALQLTSDAMYTSFLDDLYLTHRTAVLGALGLEGQF